MSATLPAYFSHGPRSPGTYDGLAQQFEAVFRVIKQFALVASQIAFYSTPQRNYEGSSGFRPPREHWGLPPDQTAAKPKAPHFPAFKAASTVLLKPARVKGAMAPLFRAVKKSISHLRLLLQQPAPASIEEEEEDWGDDSALYALLPTRGGGADPDSKYNKDKYKYVP